MGTATIGSTVAAKALGEVIIAGLLTNNTAFVVQGEGWARCWRCCCPSSALLRGDWAFRRCKSAVVRR
jgi:hypothetical protein